MTVNINTKLVIMAAILVSFFAGLVVIFQTSERARLEELFTAEEASRVTAIEKVISLIGSSLESYVYDYTYWDEMARFAETPDKTWAADNIVASLATYKADAAWVYGKNKDLIYSVNNLEDAFFEKLPVDPSSIDAIFARAKLCHFFVNTPSGLMEIRGGSIHPASDPERVTEPKGYFFAGRMWNKAFFDNLSGITDSEMRLVPASLKEEHARIVNLKRGIMTFPIILTDWEGNPLVTLETVYTSRSIISFDRISKMLFLAVYICLFVAVATVGLLTIIWLSRPIGSIVRSLEHENVSYIESLSQKRDEFGRIAKLIINFFKQRELLDYEAAVRKKSEDALEESERKFSASFYSVPVPLILSVVETGLIVDINNAFVALFGFNNNELLGNRSTDLDIISETDRYMIKKTTSLREKNNIFYGEIVMRTKQGVKKVCQVSSNIVKLDIGDCIISSILDMTDYKRNEAELMKRMEEIEQFSRIAVGRELKMIELKERIKELEELPGTKGA